MRLFLCNAFSLGMLPREGELLLRVTPITLEDARSFLATNAHTSVVGHQTTADIFSELLGLPVACNRVSLSLQERDILIVGQYRGPRLPEGATQLPEGAEISWFMVRVEERNAAH